MHYTIIVLFIFKTYFLLQVKSIDEIEIKKDGCTELEKLRSVVSGAVDSQSKTQKWIKGHNLYAALFKTQAIFFFI